MPQNHSDITDFSSIFEKQIKPAAGVLLLAEPFMESPEFKRSVVLVTEHSENGTMGFILNRKLAIKPTQAIDDFPEFEDTLFYGGPVSTELLFYIHTLGDALEGSVEVMKGIYMGGDFETLKDLLREGKVKATQIRFFAGYAGWTAGQLKSEMKEHSWIITPGLKKLVMKGNNNLWKEILRDLGGKYAMVAEFPEDPTLN
jgi:putative transcriptional regulator